MTHEAYKNLGTMNGWKFGRVPAEYDNCVRSRHMCNGHVTTVKLGNCYYECLCHKCKIRYKVDSSD